MPRFLNRYHCPECHHDWDNIWDCMVNDDCPNCDARHISPEHSDDLTQVPWTMPFQDLVKLASDSSHIEIEGVRFCDDPNAGIRVDNDEPEFFSAYFRRTPDAYGVSVVDCIIDRPTLPAAVEAAIEIAAMFKMPIYGPGFKVRLK